MVLGWHEHIVEALGAEDGLPLNTNYPAQGDKGMSASRKTSITSDSCDHFRIRTKVFACVIPNYFGAHNLRNHPAGVADQGRQYHSRLGKGARVVHRTEQTQTAQVTGYMVGPKSRNRLNNFGPGSRAT